jgi:predicted Rossmann-fold nucleotide-binding protein
MVITPDMPSRKKVFWDNCTAFLCLPGGFGTCDELYELATETKLGHQERRPIVVYSPGGFFKPMQVMHDKMVHYGLMPQERADLITFTGDIDEAVRLVTLPNDE